MQAEQLQHRSAFADQFFQFVVTVSGFTILINSTLSN
jgi:hypothetical protein